MKNFPIRSFSGIETKYDAPDQDRGTLRVAEGVVVAPQRALSFGPAWATAWGYTNLLTSLTAAFTAAGASLTKTHFATIADAAGNKFLVAFDCAAVKCRGIWHVVSGSTAPDFSATASITLSTPTGTAYRDGTAALEWYGTWIGNRLVLGNGTNTNRVWSSGALALFGPTAAVTNLADPSRYAFPACTSFLMGANGVLYGTGNAAAPRRIYASEQTNQSWTIAGLFTTDRSYADVTIYGPQDTSVVALSSGGAGIIAHMRHGGAVLITGWNQSTDGGIVRQTPLDNHAGACNPNCVVSGRESSSYLGADLELYVTKARGGESYGHGEPRDPQIETWKSSGQWNRDAVRGQATSWRPFIIDDPLNGRVWIVARLNLQSDSGLYCFDRKSSSVTGPFWYPRLQVATPLIRQDLPGTIQFDGNGASFKAVGVSASGSLLYADLGKIGELTLEAFSTAIGAAYQAVATQPTPTNGLTAIGVYASGQSFVMVDALGNVSTRASIWDAWVDAWTTVPAGVVEWYNNASLAVFELGPEDLGDPDAIKDFGEVLLQWRRNSRVYVGAWAEADGRRCGKLRSLTPYPDEEQLINLTAAGRRIRLRVGVISFFAKPVTLESVTISWL